MQHTTVFRETKSTKKKNQFMLTARFNMHICLAVHILKNELDLCSMERKKN